MMDYDFSQTSTWFSGTYYLLHKSVAITNWKIIIMVIAITHEICLLLTGQADNAEKCGPEPPAEKRISSYFKDQRSDVFYLKHMHEFILSGLDYFSFLLKGLLKPHRM